MKKKILTVAISGLLTIAVSAEAGYLEAQAPNRSVCYRIQAGAVAIRPDMSCGIRNAAKEIRKSFPDITLLSENIDFSFNQYNPACFSYTIFSTVTGPNGAVVNGTIQGWSGLSNPPLGWDPLMRFQTDGFIGTGQNAVSYMDVSFLKEGKEAHFVLKSRDSMRLIIDPSRGPINESEVLSLDGWLNKTPYAGVASITGDIFLGTANLDASVCKK